MSNVVGSFSTLGKLMASDEATRDYVILEMIGSGVLWLDASDQSSIITKTSYPDVDEWLDKSGNGNDVNQSTAANKPHFGGLVNGRNAITFDGSDDRLDGVAVVGDVTSPHTIIHVSVPTASNGTVFSEDDGTDHFDVQSVNGNSNPSFHVNGPGGFSESAIAKRTTSLNSAVITTAIIESATSRKIWSNGGFEGSDTADVTTIPTTTNLKIGYKLSGGGSPTTHFTGDICEVLVFSKVLSGAERRLVEEYLAEKWGVVLTHDNPASIEGLELWLDADDEDTITQGGSGNEVTSWSNKVTNSDAGIGALIGSTGSVPDLVRGAINGRNALLFDDSNTERLEVDIAAITSAPFTWFAVAQTNDINSAQSILQIGDKDSQANGKWVLAVRSSPSEGIRFSSVEDGAGPFESIFSGTVIEGRPFLTVAVEASSTSRSLRFNGTHIDSGTTDVSPPNADRTSVGRTGDSTPDLYFSGYICEILVYNRTLSEKEIKKLEGYLATKWGVSL